jgi:hypothetical protein
MRRINPGLFDLSIRTETASRFSPGLRHGTTADRITAAMHLGTPGSHDLSGAPKRKSTLPQRNTFFTSPCDVFVLFLRRQPGRTRRRERSRSVL